MEFTFRKKLTALIFILSFTVSLMLILYFILYGILEYQGNNSISNINLLKNTLLLILFLSISYKTYKISEDIIKISLVNHPEELKFSGGTLKEFMLFSIIDLFPLISIWAIMLPFCLILSYIIDNYILYNIEGGLILIFIVIFISFKLVDLIYENILIDILRKRIHI